MMMIPIPRLTCDTKKSSPDNRRHQIRFVRFLGVEEGFMVTCP